MQWLTAGSGVNHSEMFPLLERESDNPLELFQIWLNLPASGKFAAPHFTMYWNDRIPRVEEEDEQGRRTSVRVIAGELAGTSAPAPPPESFAARPESDLAIWTIRLETGARWSLPPAAEGVNRSLYYFRGSGVEIDGRPIEPMRRIVLRPNVAVTIINGESESEFLMLQGRPIGEPVVQHGPFVMNTEEEIRRAFADYRATQFGGWPWQESAPVHPRDSGRFARHVDGEIERP